VKRPQTLVEEQIIVEQLATWLGILDSCITDTHDCKVILRPVTLIIAKNIRQMIGAFLIEIHDSLAKVRMKNGKTHARLTIRLHIPNMRTTPMLIVTPQVHLRMTTDGNTRHIGMEHFAPIN
jgi:hypothetical protein